MKKTKNIMCNTRNLVDCKTTKIATRELSDFLQSFVYCLDENMSVPDILAHFTPKDMSLEDWSQTPEFAELQLALLQLGCRFADSHWTLLRDKWQLGKDIQLSDALSFTVEALPVDDDKRCWFVQVTRWHYDTHTESDVQTTAKNLSYAQAVQMWLNLIHQNEYGQYKNLANFYYGEEE